MSEYRYPNITGKSEAEQLSQIKSYLFQLTTQLNLAKKSADDMEKSVTYQKQTIQNDKSQSQSNNQENSNSENVEDAFFKLKNLIIKSADIVNAYYDVIEEKLLGEYEALSEFGKFREETEHYLYKSPTGTTQTWESLKKIVPYIYGTVEGDELTVPEGTLSQFRKDGGYLKTGFLDDEHTVFGVEIGQTIETASSTDSAFARFTPTRLSFFDPTGRKDEDGNPVELAYFGDNKLSINDAEITGSLTLGKYMIDTSNGLVFKWIG